MNGFVMEVSLEIISGTQAGEKFPFRSGRMVQIGRGPAADIAIIVDPLLSESHFAFYWDESGCRIQDLKSARGTRLNGQWITQATARHGDKIVAGQTHFIVRVKPDPGIRAVGPIAHPHGLVTEARNWPPTAEPLQTRVQTFELRNLIALLTIGAEPLFAILDSARDPQVLDFLRECNQRHQSLYEGAKGEELAQFAPYLVEFPSNSVVVENLVREGWGKSWGICFTSGANFNETRRHFRHFLLVKAEHGRALYFRFYDPRVLRNFLPTCNSQETTVFFGPVQKFLVEAQDAGTLLRFSHSRGVVTRESLPLSAAIPVSI